jgi:AcrR family transcriptional regulator
MHNGRVRDGVIGREAQRRQTRARVLDAAIVEFQRSGAGSADINAIAESAGVSRSTFYFHFPTKDHVLLELIRRDESRLGEELSRFLESPHDLQAVLEEIIRLVVALEKQWGAGLFRDVIGLYFSPTRLGEEQWSQHPTYVLLAAEIERARHRGELYDDVDSLQSAAFFLVGLHALLMTNRELTAEREDVLRKFVTSTLRSVQPSELAG